MCGCKTPNLQMSNKTCENGCYPPMMNKKVWNHFKEDKVAISYRTKELDLRREVVYSDNYKTAYREYGNKLGGSTREY